MELILWNDGGVETALRDCLIDADKYKLSQVIRNLTCNALKFTPEGGTVIVKASVIETIPQPTAASSITMGGHVLPEVPYLRIEVSDNGYGIAKVFSAPLHAY